VSTLRYLADVRMPTEKAHGWQIVQMCRAFAATGVDVELCTPKRRQPTALMETQSPFDYYGVERTFTHRYLPDIDLVRLEQRLPSWLETSVNQLHSYAWGRQRIWIERRQPSELLYTRDLGIAAGALRRGVPLGWEVHAFPGARGRRMLARGLKVSRPRTVVALTPFLREALLRVGFFDHEIIVEGDAVDPTSSLEPLSHEAARAIVGLPQGPMIGFVGRFQAMESERGLLDLIRASARVQTTPEPTLVLLGGPMELAPRYRAAAAEVGLRDDRLLMFDRVPNDQVPVWLQALDIGAMPYSETKHHALAASPLKMFEYMEAGLPIVASDLPSIRLHLRDGQNALLVRPGDPALFAEAITRLINDPALGRRLAAQARADVSGLTWRARAERILLAAGVGP
jgi:glycosyltransferase involved in cell wall biosynthesis